MAHSQNFSALTLSTDFIKNNTGRARARPAIRYMQTLRCSLDWRRAEELVGHQEPRDDQSRLVPSERLRDAVHFDVVVGGTLPLAKSTHDLLKRLAFGNSTLEHVENFHVVRRIPS